MTFTMTSQTPAVAKRIVVCSSSSENHDHTSGSSGLAQGSRMIDSGRGGLSFVLNLGPDKWRFLYIEDPAIVDWFLADVTSEDNEVRFGERECVAVAFSGGFMRYIDDVPDADAVSDVEMVEVVRGESSGTGGSSKDDDFVGFDADGSVGGTGRGGGSGSWIM